MKIIVPYYREINYLQKYIQDELFLFILIYIIYSKLKKPIRNFCFGVQFQISDGPGPENPAYPP